MLSIAHETHGNVADWVRLDDGCLGVGPGLRVGQLHSLDSHIGKSVARCDE